MAFGALLGSGTGLATSPGTSITVSAGFTVATDDLVIVMVSMRGVPTSPAVTDGLAGSYANIQSSDVAANLCYIGVWWKIITTGGTCTPVCTFSSTTNDVVIIARRHEGPWDASPVDADTTAVSDTATPFTCPATGTLAQADEMVFAAGSARNALTTVTATSPMGDIVSANSSTGANSISGHTATKVVASTTTTTPEFAVGAPASASWYTASFKQGAVGPTAWTGEARLAGAGALSGAVRQQAVARATLSGAGAVSAAVRQALVASARLAGTGGLSANVQFLAAGTAWAAEARFAGVGGFSAHVITKNTKYLRPEADDALGDWLNEIGGTVLFSSIDEAEPGDDNDYIQSGPDPVADICRFRLPGPALAPAMPAGIRLRYRRGGSDAIDLTTRLKQGTVTIAEWTDSNIATEFVTVGHPLLQAEFDAITNPNDLFVELQADLGSNFLLDNLSASAIIAYSTRKLRSAYAGSALRVRRSSDNAEQDIGFSANDLDTAAMATFVGANNGLLRTFYDQSASAADAEQSTSANQPIVVASGTNKTRNGHVCFQTTSTGDQRLSFTKAQAQPFTIAMCFKLNDIDLGPGASAHFTDGDTVGTRPLIGTGDFATNAYQMYAGSAADFGGALDLNTHSMFGVFNGASCALFVDGVSIIANSLGTNSMATQMYGSAISGSANDCDYCEYLVFPGVLSAGDMALIRASWQAYWGAP